MTSDDHFNKLYKGPRSICYEKYFSKPADNNQEIDFLWQNVYHDPNDPNNFKAFYSECDGSSLALMGKPLYQALSKDWIFTDENTKSKSRVIAVIRAHQHLYGPDWIDETGKNLQNMMPSLFTNKGVYSAFTGSEVFPEQGSIKEDSIYTLMVQPNNIFGYAGQKKEDNQYPGFNYATGLKVTTSSTEDTFLYERINKPVFPKPPYKNYSTTINGNDVVTYLEYEQN